MAPSTLLYILLGSLAVYWSGTWLSGKYCRYQSKKSYVARQTDSLNSILQIAQDEKLTECEADIIALIQRINGDYDFAISQEFWDEKQAICDTMESKLKAKMYNDFLK